MIFIEDTLGVGNIMDSRYRAVLNAKVALQYINNWGEAIRRAGRCRDNILAHVPVVINAHNNIQRTIFDGC